MEWSYGRNGCGNEPKTVSGDSISPRQSQSGDNVGEQILVAAGGEMGINDIVSGNGAKLVVVSTSGISLSAEKPWSDFESCQASLAIALATKQYVLVAEKLVEIAKRQKRRK